MEFATGVQLLHKWPDMKLREKINCIQSIYQQMQQLAALDFSAFGSLYFSNVSLDPSEKFILDGDFCIGPTCAPEHWNKVVGDSKYYDHKKPNRGPCM